MIRRLRESARGAVAAVRERDRMQFGMRRCARAFTIIELTLAVVIVAILSGIAMESARMAKVRASVAVSKAHIREMVTGIETYRVDQGAYPDPRTDDPADPFGVVSGSAIPMLTTPVAYVGMAGHSDPFGAIQLQGSASRQDMFGFVLPVFNPNRALLYFNYPRFSEVVHDPGLKREAFAIISLGPDQKDSFGVYRHFPESLPSRASRYGINHVEDTIYDPTNGVVSSGDITGFGGDLASPIAVAHE